MTKRAWVLWGVALVGLAGAVLVLDPLNDGTLQRVLGRLPKAEGAAAQAPRGQQGGGGRAIPVEIAKAAKKPVPVRVEALGNVTPIASVAIKSRIETMITEVHFNDGAFIKQGDLLFILDSRQIAAQIKQSEAIIAGARAQLEQAQRDVERHTELMAKNATTQVALQNARTQVNIWRATVESNTAHLDNLKVQLDYCTIRAPISGRISAANVKVGSFVRPSDLAPLATINQIAPIYVSFGISQRVLPEVRDALVEGSGQVEASVPSESRRAKGRVTMIENAVDAATGMVMVRATMDNVDEMLWPGTLVNTQLTLRVEQAVTVPTVAVQTGQTGTFVFVVKDNVASVQPVQVIRTLANEAVIGKGLNGDETVVTEGQLLLTNGARVAPRAPAQAGS
jgi:membrane fusion protein, multidrug efflux system